ncbi:MAG TPA: glycoside hydrolase family 88 protein [Oscillospiraceae bacterium]|nr:glycoside hydrolase family 88 protein [Oscillospiraceae bacterium]HPF56251.1 glycoside hydrolase family 88 protein [Clostridiales bacterium]HPK35956.1 glycoside hydrolase family 88 protein [Oscillospiraceae bacterium]HPR76670.1 glycoside hydrolase family 88 protein [Oscillospiraceae bacterium]
MEFKDFIEKIDHTIAALGGNLREYPACATGNYLENREKSLPLSSISNWTQSFFTGEALLAYAYTGDRKYTDWCERFYGDYYDKVFKTPNQTMHDLGFLFTPYAVGLYRLLKEDKMRELGLRAAQVLAMRFDPKSRHIRAWGNMQNELPDDLPFGDDGSFYLKSDGMAIIDCMMNLPLLLWASETLNHPFYRKIACAHADMTMHYFIRKDGSVCHAYRFNPETGAPIGEDNNCGWSVGSHWSRGTAWAVYGFAILYGYTRDKRYYETSERLAKDFLRLSGGKVPVWDFRLPKSEPQNLDTSAAAITACGLYELFRYSKDEKLKNGADGLMADLERYVNTDPKVMGVLKEQNGRHYYTCFGDYFYLEALVKREKDYRVW